MAKMKKVSQPKGVQVFCSKEDMLQCKGEPYLIKRLVCWARRKEGRPACRSCPERVGQLYLFGSPRQIR